jgi:2-polyprenyl-3-methyl-5-hydroxy-6-metoxy-1,4-benzoquinol methylase
MSTRLQAAARRAGGLAQSLGVLRYRPEQWSAVDWARAYGTGQLDYFGRIDELSRYSIIVGYLRFFGGAPSVLDVGCGTGLLRARLGDDDFSTYLGIDTSSAAIERAGHLVDDRSTYRCCDVADLERRQFDVVVLNEVLYFASSPDALLENASRLLSPEGLLLTSVWRHPGDAALWRLLDDRFELLDRVEVRNRASRLARRGWRVACHRRAA